MHGILVFTVTIKIFLVGDHQSGSITNHGHTYVIPYKKTQFESLDFASQFTSSSAVSIYDLNQHISGKQSKYYSSV